MQLLKACRSMEHLSLDWAVAWTWAGAWAGAVAADGAGELLPPKDPAIAPTAWWAMALPVPKAMPWAMVEPMPDSMPPPPLCCCMGAGAWDAGAGAGAGGGAARGGGAAMVEDDLLGAGAERLGADDLDLIKQHVSSAG